MAMVEARVLPDHFVDSLVNDLLHSLDVILSYVLQAHGKLRVFRVVAVSTQPQKNRASRT